MITEKIYCKKIEFYQNVTLGDINYFNRNYLTVASSGEKFELNHLSISKIKYDQSKVLSGDTLELIKKCNNISIEFDNSLKEYFGVESTNRKFLYVFWISYNNNNIFSGATTQEGIKFVDEPNNEKIMIECKSLLNHFLEFYRTKNCNLTEVEPVFTKYVPSNNSSDADYRSSFLTDFLKKLFFDNPNFVVLNNTGYAWEINRQPLFYIDPVISNTTYQFVSNGFRKISAPTATGYDGNIIGQFETKTDFFVKLCNAMGWDFTLSSNFSNEMIYLSIYNRYRTTIGISETVNELASINYNTEFTDSYVDYIIIKDGQVTADNTTYGGSDSKPIKIIDDKGGVYSNRSYFFKSAAYIADGSFYKLYQYPSTETFMASNALSEGNYLDYGEITYPTVNNWFSRTNTRNRIENKFILYIDAGENSKGTAVDFSTGLHAKDTDSIGDIETGTWFKGCYGSMLFYRDGYNIKNYDDYSRTSTFKNNFLTLFRSKETDIIEVVFNKLFTDYYTSNYSQISLTGGNTYLNTTWNITELELDLKAEQTKMKLKRAA